MHVPLSNPSSPRQEVLPMAVPFVATGQSTVVVQEQILRDNLAILGARSNMAISPQKLFTVVHASPWTIDNWLGGWPGIA